MFVYHWDMSEALTIDELDELEALDPSLLSDSEIRETFIELRRENDRREAVAARLLVALHGRGIPAGEGATSTPVWVQFHTGQRFRDARISLATGRACESLPLVAKAWAQGEISADAAAAIAQGRRSGHRDVYATMEDRLVGYAAARDFVALDAMIRRYQTHCDELDEKPPTDKNGFFISEVGNRFASKGDHDALGGATIKKAVDVAIDKPGEDDDRTPAQRRDAALVRICRYFLDQGERPTEDGERPHIAITATLETLLSGKLETTGDLALAPSQISRLLCDSKIQLIVLDENGAPLAAAVRRPPALPEATTGRDPPRPQPVPISELRPKTRRSPPRHRLPQGRNRDREPRVPVRLPPPRPAQAGLARVVRRHHVHRHQSRTTMYRQHLNASSSNSRISAEWRCRSRGR
jgi:hypothetical protein